jgi:hypothetical protein
VMMGAGRTFTAAILISTSLQVIGLRERPSRAHSFQTALAKSC